MTDVRATWRLLEFISEQRTTAAHWTTDPAARDALEQIENAVVELRRRGDTLVHREDLRTVLEAVGRDALHSDEWVADAALNAAWDRLLATLGGA